MLRPFFEAYEIVADVLCQAPAEISDKDLTKEALGVGGQYAAQGVVSSTEDVGVVVRHRSPTGGRPESCSVPRPRWLNAGGISWPNCTESSPIWIVCGSPASSSMPVKQCSEVVSESLGQV